ncbi:acylneuraminate cytidylyltransferase family protein [Pseudoalteromonas sp. APC 3213]|uniref:acylneuraminate cytidylyltransferase family protein n=1 Tax=Pseudoalteromonas sp. APC 3213 TaxID=3035178 RepID=UPI0025B60D61|nr:acylneuraminate cytidylyltransferase family protein [Pseudoalteromonas sp. APC 3213]MDN3401229.1 acylneuraminate cytidylyltransferase family protein [Pseudoalteromonas sp. APC 3213]
MKPKVLAVVPARAGSKRLPQKNIKLFNGLPLIAHTFEAIKNSKYISATIATSDCPEVLKISAQYADTYPLNRPAELASDTATTVDVVLHAVEYAKKFEEFDIVCLLQPTSPLRTTQDIDNAIALYVEKEAKGVVSMSKCEHSPLWATPLDRPDEFKNFIKGLTNARSQDIKEFYQLNGAIYLVDHIILIKTKKIFLEDDYYPFIMTSENSVDIDTLLDFKFAELLVDSRVAGK